MASKDTDSPPGSGVPPDTSALGLGLPAGLAPIAPAVGAAAPPPRPGPAPPPVAGAVLLGAGGGPGSSAGVAPASGGHQDSLPTQPPGAVAGPILARPAARVSGDHGVCRR